MLNSKELLFTVDDQNNPIQPQERELVHSNGVWHRTSHIWIVNDSKEILCQQRSLLKDSNPGLWEPFFGGHLAPDTSYEECAVTEVKEELGISIHQSDLELYSICKADNGTEFQGVFILRWNGDPKLLNVEADEVEAVKFLPLDSLEELLVHKPSSDWSIASYSANMLSHIRISHK